MKAFKYILMVLGTLLAIFIIGLVGYIEGHYTRNGEITNIKGMNISVITEDGNEWMFKGNGFTVGDNVKITFDNNGTDLELTDDIIEKVVLK